MEIELARFEDHKSPPESPASMEIILPQEKQP